MNAINLAKLNKLKISSTTLSKYSDDIVSIKNDINIKADALNLDKQDVNNSQILIKVNGIKTNIDVLAKTVKNLSVEFKQVAINLALMPVDPNTPGLG